MGGVSLQLLPFNALFNYEEQMAKEALYRQHTQQKQPRHELWSRKFNSV